MDPVLCCLPNFIHLLPCLQAAVSLCSLLQLWLHVVAIEMAILRLICKSVRWSRDTLL
jgi:hypothetical protein